MINENIEKIKRLVIDIQNKSLDLPRAGDLYRQAQVVLDEIEKIDVESDTDG